MENLIDWKLALTFCTGIIMSVFLGFCWRRVTSLIVIYLYSLKRARLDKGITTDGYNCLCGRSFLSQDTRRAHFDRHHNERSPVARASILSLPKGEKAHF